MDLKKALMAHKKRLWLPLVIIGILSRHLGVPSRATSHYLLFSLENNYTVVIEFSKVLLNLQVLWWAEKSQRSVIRGCLHRCLAMRDSHRNWEGPWLPRPTLSLSLVAEAILIILREGISQEVVASQSQPNRPTNFWLKIPLRVINLNFTYRYLGKRLKLALPRAWRTLTIWRKSSNWQEVFWNQLRIRTMISRDRPLLASKLKRALSWARMALTQVKTSTGTCQIG